MSAQLDGAPVHAVLFDYGHTLVTFSRPPALLKLYSDITMLLAAGGGFVAAPSIQLVMGVHQRIEGDVTAQIAAGPLQEIDLSAAYLRAYGDAGLVLPCDLIDRVMDLEQRAWWPSIEVGPDVVSVLSTLRAAGIRVGLCSNAPYRPDSLQAQLEHVGLAELLDATTFSSAVGWRKPAPQMFEAAMRALGCMATTTVMVGDRVREDIAGAHSIGMRGVRLREHADDADPNEVARATLDRLRGLPALLGIG